MTPEYADIQRLLDAMHSACSVDRAARTPATRLAVGVARRVLIAARETVRNDFAEKHGLRHTPRGFTVGQLRNGHHSLRWTDDLWPISNPVNPIDHAEYYRFAWGPRFPAAIVSHEYGSFEGSVAFAKANGLVATRLPASWYAPTQATAVVYTSPLIPFPPVQ
jgi:hypothetical protein